MRIRMTWVNPNKQFMLDITLIFELAREITMSNKILVGIDGSPGSLRAAECAANQAKLSNAQLIVAYIIEWSPYSFNTPEENETRHKRREQEIKQAQDKVLDPLLESLRESGTEVSGLVHHGKPADLINDLAAEHEVSQVYVGRVGESGLKTLIFGSVASNLVQTSKVPVTVVP